MNHFLLWTGKPDHDEALGDRLLAHFKDAQSPHHLRGRDWSLTIARQHDGSGALEDRRIVTSPVVKRGPTLVWVGHAWSDQGPQPAFLKRHDGDSPTETVARVRENTDGVFSLLCIDENSDEIAVAADCLGSFHVYFRKFDDAVAVSNSSALLAALSPAASLDPTGVQEFCSLAVANEDRTIWSGVHKLRGGQILRLFNGGRGLELVSHRPLLHHLARVEVPLNEAVPSLHRAISDVLSTLAEHGGRGTEYLQLPWVADLTGGNDSRALVAALLSNRVRFTATVTGSETNEDVIIGRRVAAIAGVPHITRPEQGPIDPATMFDAYALTDGEFDAIEFAAIAAVHRQHRHDGLQFSINGSYGETGRGYPWRLGPRAVFTPDRLAARLLDRSPIDARLQGTQRFKPAVPPGLFAADVRLSWADHGPGMVGRLLEYADGLPQCAQLDLLHVDLRMERWQGRIASSANQIWPAISPWGFRGPLQQLLTTSPLARRNSLLTRAFTAAYAPRLADELLFTGNPARPFTWSQSIKFLPAIGWYGKRAREKVLERFAPPPTQSKPSASLRQPKLCQDPDLKRWMAEPLLAATGLFNRDALAEALAPDTGRSEPGYRLWCRLMTLELGLRRQQEARLIA